MTSAMKRLCGGLAALCDVMLALALPGVLVLCWIVARDERRDIATRAADAGLSPTEYEKRELELGI